MIKHLAVSAEQEARDMLERMGVEDAESFTAGDLVELANLLAAVGEIRRSVEDEGPEPAYHRAIVKRHRKEWPTLWRALDRLL
jgi:hypothetical protein